MLGLNRMPAGTPKKSSPTKKNSPGKNSTRRNNRGLNYRLNNTPIRSFNATSPPSNKARRAALTAVNWRTVPKSQGGRRTRRR